MSAADDQWADTLPFALSIGPYRYEVRLMERTSYQASQKFGACDHVGHVILLSPAMNAQQAAITLLHEILHASWTQYQLGAEAIEERAVSLLAQGIAEVLRDNNTLHEWLQDCWSER